MLVRRHGLASSDWSSSHAVLHVQRDAPCSPSHLLVWCRRLLQFLASDLGALQYPQYQVHRTQPAFRSRTDLLDYERALGHASEMNNALEVRSTVFSSAAAIWASCVFLPPSQLPATQWSC